MGGKWEQTAILVIDMQKDFIHWDGLLRVNGGKAIIPNVVREHDPQGREVEWFRHHLYAASKLGPTVKGSVSAELVDGLVIEEDPSYAFFATHLHSFLESYGIGDLVIPGVQAPNCIRQTVFDAVTLDYKSVTVIADATAAATPEAHAVGCSSTTTFPELRENLHGMRVGPLGMSCPPTSFVRLCIRKRRK